MFGAGAQPPRTPPRTLSYGFIMPSQRTHTLGHSRMATRRSASWLWNSSGNIFSRLNLSAKKPYSAALLMELVLFLHCEGCSIAPNHVPREYNTWADELTHPDFEGFSLDCRLPAPETLFVFPFATRLLSSTGFSWVPTQDPVTGSGGLSSRPCRLAP